jgi:glutamyl-tRNA reductase
MIGAGETGSLVLQNFHKNGNPKITVTNRTEEKASKLAGKHNCTILPFEQMPSHLFLYDIIIVATGSKTPLVTREMVEESLKNRKNEQQVFIDISVPRNIENSIEQLEAIQLFTIDDFNEIIQTNMEKRKDSLETAHEIISEIVNDFSEWLASRSLKPAIQAITYNLQKISKEEVSGYNKVDSEEIQMAINEFSKHLAQKYTRLFIKNLKEMTANGKKTDTLKLVNELFSISE